MNMPINDGRWKCLQGDTYIATFPNGTYADISINREAGKGCLNIGLGIINTYTGTFPPQHTVTEALQAFKDKMVEALAGMEGLIAWSKQNNISPNNEEIK